MLMIVLYQFEIKILQKIRSISYNTGKKMISKNRYKLINKKYNFMFNYKSNPKEDYFIDNPTV